MKKKRNLDGMKVNPYMRVKKEAPRSRRRHVIKYDFLKNIRLVYRWALSNNDLTRPHLEMLLYLYGIGSFSKHEFVSFYKTMGMYTRKGFNLLRDEGWIKLFRKKTAKQNALYTLTDKAKRVCMRMHRICAGEEDIPTTAAYNNMVNSSKTIDHFYMKLVNKMNKDRKK